MTMRADVHSVFHNAETSQFEAEVVLHDGAVRHCYSVQVLAPITAEFDALRPALIRAAEVKHNGPGADLRARRAETPLPNRTKDLLERILSAQPNYLQDILARAA